MIHLDYWNHPLIVKAFRVRYRGSRLFIIATGYLLLLMAFGIVLFNYREPIGLNAWPRVYFVSMISIQFVVASLIAVSAVSSSMQSEVSTRTLDFQRIAAISPLQILLGKVIGEPASSYMLSMATLPIAVLCCTMGGVSPPAVVLLYITLATTTFMMASLGSMHTLDPASKANQPAIVAGVLFFLSFSAVSIPLGFGARGGFAELIEAAVGLLTPILTLKGIVLPGNTLWTGKMSFYEFKIPYAILTPIAQTAVAAFALLCMKRRLTQPLITSISRVQSYAILTLLDFLWAALQYDSIKLGEGLTAPAVRFAIGHTVMSMLLIARCTPGRESFQSWVWRLRGRRRLFMDLLVGERSLNVLALIVYCVIGLAMFACAVAIPAKLFFPAAMEHTHMPGLMISGVASILLVLCYGLFFQVLSIAAGKNVSPVFFVAVLVAVVAPYAIGEAYDLPVVSSLSPIATFVRLQDQALDPYSPVPFVIAHTMGIAFWSCGLWGISRRMTRQVDRKLEKMGIPQRTVGFSLTPGTQSSG